MPITFLFLTKLNAYEFDYKSITPISSFLSNRTYRTKLNSSFSIWEDLLIGVTQGSVLGPLLMYLYKCDRRSLCVDESIKQSKQIIRLYVFSQKNLFDVFLRIYILLREKAKLLGITVL